MKILKTFFIGLAAFCLMVAAVGCPNGMENSTINVDTNNDGTKITSLKAVLESDDIKDGSIIDLSLAKYKSITDFNAVVNKSVTIMSGSDFKGGELKIVADGVVLDNINNASVSTQASLKISGSTLNDLNIVEIDSSAANANEVIGRGVDRWWFDRSKPIVTTRKKTRIKKKVKVSIPETVLTINDSEAAKIEISGENAQVTVEGTDTKIDAIETDTVCQVVLEDGTSDNIATPVVTSAEGELKQINMQAAGGMKLLKLTPSSGLETIVAKGESIDFSKVAVLGTYQSVDGVTLFKVGGLSYNLTETFSKLESDFIITIDGATVYKNGAPVKTFSWAGLDAGKYTAYIDKDYDDTEDGYKYKFDITVTDAGTNVSDLTFQLTEISVQSDNAKTTYLVGDKLNLRGIVVLGTYKAGTIEYTGIISDYTLSVENGTVLSAAGKQDITITAGDKTGKVEITVNVPTVTQVKVTFVVDKDDPSKNSTRSIDKDTVITAPSMSKPDWTFDGWFTSLEYKTLYDFSTPVTADLTLYAKWTKNEGTDPIDPTDESDDTNQPAPNKPVDTSIKVPTNVQVTECTQVPNSVNVTWTATGEQVYYFVFYSKSNDPATAVVAKWYGMATGTTSNAISSIVLPSSGTYYFWVAAADAQFYSQVTKRSEFSSVKTYQFTYTQLEAPINVSITKSDVTNCVKVTCEPTETANYYWVYVAAENDLSKAKIRGMLYKSNSYTDIALTANGTYYFWLRPDIEYNYIMNDEGYPLGCKPSANAGAFSNAASYTFNKWTKLDAPTAINVIPSTTNKVKVVWSGSETITYWVYYGTSNDSSKATLCCDVDIRQFSQDNGYGGHTEMPGYMQGEILLSDTAKYYFWVRTDNNVVEDYTNMFERNPSPNASDFSLVAEYDFIYTTLSAPTDVSVKQISSKRATVSWKPNGAPYYGIFISKTNDVNTAEYISYEYGYNYEVQSDTIILPAYGVHYIWLGASDDDAFRDGDRARIVFGQSVSVDFKNEPMAAPTGLKAELYEDNDECVTLSCVTEAPFCWIYMSTTDRTADAQYVQSYPSVFQSCNVNLSDKSAGTYYFWIKAADGQDPDFSDGAYPDSSDFSAAVSYEYAAPSSVWTFSGRISDISDAMGGSQSNPQFIVVFLNDMVIDCLDSGMSPYDLPDYAKIYLMNSNMTFDTDAVGTLGVYNHTKYFDGVAADVLTDGTYTLYVDMNLINKNDLDKFMGSVDPSTLDLSEYFPCVLGLSTTGDVACTLWSGNALYMTNSGTFPTNVSKPMSVFPTLADVDTFYLDVEGWDISTANLTVGSDVNIKTYTFTMTDSMIDENYPNYINFSFVYSRFWNNYQVGPNSDTVLSLGNEIELVQTKYTSCKIPYQEGLSVTITYRYDPDTGKAYVKYETQSTTPQQTLDTPTNVTVTAGDNNTTVNLSWSAVTGATNYCITYNKNGVSGVQSQKQIVSGTSAQITVDAYTDYYFSVMAIDAAVLTEVTQYSQPSTPIFFYALAAPTNVTAAKGSDDNKVSLTWDAVGGATEYLVYYSTDGERPDNYTSYTTNSCEIELSESGVYSFWIQAVHSDNGTVTSSSLYGTATYNCTTTSGFNLQVKSGLSDQSYPSDNKVCLTWNAVSGAAYYHVYISDQPVYINATLQMGWISSQEEYLNHDVYLTEDGHYYFWVTSVERYGDQGEAINESEPSNMADIEFTYTSLKQPTNVQVTAAENRKNHVQLSWNYDGIHEPFFVYYSKTNDPDTAAYYDTAVSGSVASGNGVYLKASGTYYFWVCAGNDPRYVNKGHGPFSEAVSYTHTYQELVAPTVTLTNNGTDVTISWGEPQANYYWIYKGTTINSDDAERENPPADCTVEKWTSYTLDVESTGTYYFWVRAADTEYDATYPEQIQSNLSNWSTIQSIVIP